MSEDRAGGQGSGAALQKSCESNDLVKKCKQGELKATNQTKLERSWNTKQINRGCVCFSEHTNTRPLVLGVPRLQAASSARPGLLGAEAQRGASCARCSTELGALDLDLPRAACGRGTEVG